ncbi:symmetrical bis(5'-nucleosyl)-tetraphosphatase [Noviherbaspirillum cavernae]|uniref:Bis(5'-nucleosyl)-tetraphosphatase, symmetrical n=1 Tax=Noviherbaspirillum cavernae TaxID=2320862 RepID=A0A418WY49_9BURK|nr:symmetrical bis(5'-nucleosyl)-tetraphosphatase [Noviherbaspirillum cavernae]RJG05121.1 symmetrical bis(5'-nucleosyl)-tetraphosphatase [Noviherbaspirillum cavernae]
MTTYAIGDIQGCQQQLTALLQRIYETSPSPRLIFVGDLVNRGPHSLATLRNIRALGDTASVVLGNHDLHLLAVANGIRKPHRSDTLDDILNAEDRDELLDWLRRQPLALLENGHLFVHAGVVPQWTAQQAVDLAHEVETALRGPDWVEFLRTMYGNAPARWDDALEGADRLRCIVNALTRLRFCTADGTMEMLSKGVETVLPGYMPWFDVPGRKTEDVTVVAGHWSTLGLMMRPNLLTLDTGCLWGGKLTAVRLEDRASIQVDCPQYQTPGTM